MLYVATTRNSLPQKAKQATAAGDEAALVAVEVDMAEDEGGTPALSTVSTLVTRTVPTIELRSYHCKALKAEVAAVDTAWIEDVPKRPPDRNVSSPEIVEYDTTQSDDATDTREALTEDKGGRHGRGFGRGTYE
jgi:hypothetical protein